MLESPPTKRGSGKGNLHDQRTTLHKKKSLLLWKGGSSNGGIRGKQPLSRGWTLIIGGKKGNWRGEGQSLLERSREISRVG